MTGTLTTSPHLSLADCIVQCFKFSVKCPICSTPYATMIGKMPKGTMTVTRCVYLTGAQSRACWVLVIGPCRCDTSVTHVPLLQVPPWEVHPRRVRR